MWWSQRAWAANRILLRRAHHLHRNHSHLVSLEVELVAFLPNL